MKPIIVDKAWLITQMEENRDKHERVFNAALEGFRAEAVESLETTIKALAAGKTPAIHIILARPENHTRDYERVIGMLRAHKGNEYELTEQDYAHYVDDDWDWKRQFLRMSNQYAAGTTQQVYATDFLNEE